MRHPPQAIAAAAAKQVPYTAGELASAEKSLRNVAGDAPFAAAYGVWLRQCAHLPHKDWARTAASAAALSPLLGAGTAAFREVDRDALEEGASSLLTSFRYRRALESTQ